MQASQVLTSGANTLEIVQLKAHVRRLITLEETEAPVVSCYVSLDGVREGFPSPLEKRVRTVRKVLEREKLEAFEEALEQIKRFVAMEVGTRTRGIAAFARGGAEPFFLGLQFQVPLPDRLLVDSTPNIYHLVKLKDTYDRYVVLITTEESARILEVALGAITKELWAERPELRERVGREWTHEHYQNHLRNRSERFLKEKIEVLERVMSAGGHTHLILAGSPRMTARVKNRLPEHLATKLIDIVPAAASARITDVVAATLSSFIEREEQESLDAVAALVKDLRRGGLAVAGIGATLEALRCGQVDVLVIATTCQPPPGWGCKRCGWLDAGLASPGSCPECSAAEVRSLDIKEAMVKLAERQSAEVEFVRHSDVLMELGGVGCLLRYVTPELGGWAAGEGSTGCK